MLLPDQIMTIKHVTLGCSGVARQSEFATVINTRVNKFLTHIISSWHN